VVTGRRFNRQSLATFGVIAAPRLVAAANGPDQEAWLAEELRASKRRATAWRLIARQCMFGQMVDAAHVIQNTDQWDGYPLSRKAVLDQLAAEQIDDTVIVAGDLHSSWALDIAPDPFAPAYDATTGPAISSPSPFADKPDVLEREQRSMTQPHIHWVEFRSRRYLLVDVTPTRSRGEWWLQEDITKRGTPERLAIAMETQRGRNHLVAV